MSLASAGGVAPDPGSVRDNVGEQRFELAVGDAVAFINYRRVSEPPPGLVILLHTEVPPRFAGRGVGAALVRGTLELLRSAGVRARSRCSFVDLYVARHPDYRDLMA